MTDAQSHSVRGRVFHDQHSQRSRSRPLIFRAVAISRRGVKDGKGCGDSGEILRINHESETIRRNTLNKKTIIATITLLVAAVALTALAFGASQDCCKGAQDCCRPARECCKPAQDCCKGAQDCCNTAQDCCKGAQDCCKPAQNCCNPPQGCCAAMRRSAAAGFALRNGAQTATIEVNGEGFQPSTLKLKAAVPAKVTFVRKTDETCAKEVVIKEYNIDRKLPLNEPVTVEFTPRKGEFIFACGMDMLKGKLIVE